MTQGFTARALTKITLCHIRITK